MTFNSNASGDRWECTSLWGCAPVWVRRWLSIATALWGILVLVAFLALAFYSESPSRASIAPEQLSADLLQTVGHQPGSDSWLLVMAVHPQCPCTRASIRELERVVAQCREPIAVRFLQMIPSDAGPDWLDTRLVSRADRIEGSESIPDQDGKIAEQLGMFTSGALVLCSPDGEVKFSGGITIARGHEGDNLGRNSIVSIVNTGRVLETSTPVFGCGLSQGGGR